MLTMFKLYKTTALQFRTVPNKSDDCQRNDVGARLQISVLRADTQAAEGGSCLCNHDFQLWVLQRILWTTEPERGDSVMFYISYLLSDLSTVNSTLEIHPVLFINITCKVAEVQSREIAILCTKWLKIAIMCIIGRGRSYYVAIFLDHYQLLTRFCCRLVTFLCCDGRPDQSACGAAAAGDTIESSRTFQYRLQRIVRKSVQY